MKVDIRRSTVIDAPVDEVWAILRDFNGHEPLASRRRDERRSKTAKRRSDRRGAQLSAEGRLAHSRAAALSLRRQAKLRLLHSRGAGAAAQLCRARPAAAGDRATTPACGNGAPPSTRRPRSGSGWSALCATTSSRRASPGCALSLTGRRRARRRPLRRRYRLGERRLEGVEIVLTRYGGPEVLEPQARADPSAGPGRSAHSADRGRRQFHRRLLPPRQLRSGRPRRRARHGGGRRGRKRRAERRRRPARRSRRLRLRAARRLCVDADDAVRICWCRLPQFLSDEIAAALLLKGVTAGFLLHDVASVSNEAVVLVHAAAGGVGRILCRWAKALGAT